jgi:23S rRNA pseudouridine1911/1915/1917 synthase
VTSKKPERFVAHFRGEPERLDKALVSLFGEALSLTRAQAERLIEQGHVTINGKVAHKASTKVAAGQQVEVVPPNPAPSHLSPLELPLDVLFEDQHLIVINKPCGLSMHPGAGNSSHTLANAVVAHVGPKQKKVGEADRPGIVHRLDKDTTGVVVVAKSTAVLGALAKQFSERTIERSYLALVFSTPRAVRTIQKSEEGVVNGAIGRHPRDRKLMAISERGKPAITRWRVIERFTYGTLIECKLETGRTHQIRVHMNSVGSPVIGDTAYGDFSSLPAVLRDAAHTFGRQALHAYTLGFTHPVTKASVSYSAHIPPDMASLVELFRSYNRASC